MYARRASIFCPKTIDFLSRGNLGNPHELFDIERRTKMEYNAYRREVKLARENNREDISKKLIQLCKEEIESFGGEWDENKLE